MSVLPHLYTQITSFLRCESLLVARFILQVFNDETMNILFESKAILTYNTTARFLSYLVAIRQEQNG